MAKDIKSSVRRIQRAKTDIVRAIETKGVSVPDGAKIDDMPELISHIESGGIDTSDATATADNIEYGKTAYTAKGKEVGKLDKTSSLASTKTSVTAERKTPMVGSPYYIIGVSADELTAPSSTGRYIIDAAKLNVSMDVNASVFGDAAASNVLKGKTFTSSAGLAVAGTHECPAPKLHEKQITPSAAAETYYPDEGYDGISKISVVGDSDLSPENIVYGKQVFDVVGSHKCPTFTTQEKTVTPSANSQTVQPDSGYDGLSQVTVSGDTNLTPANIRKDISIFGVTGMMDPQSGGIDTSDATATVNDIAKDKTAYVNGEKITGTLKKPGFSTAEVDYFVASGTITIPYVRTTTHTTSDGIFRTTDDVILAVAASKYGDASASDVAKGKTFTSKNGVKIEGTYEPPSTEPSLQAKSVTPAAQAQTVTPDSGYDGLSSVAVAGDANLKAENIVKDVSIFGVTGTHTCKQPSLQTKSVTPSTAAKTVTADSGYDGLSQVTVAGDSNLIAANIKKGVSIFGIAGTHETTATGGSSDNNCEAYPVDVTNPTVNFKTASGTIKAYGYAYATSSSGWGGSTTSVYAFNGTNYYKSVSYGSPQSANITLGVSGGKLTGLPTLNGGTLLVVRGI